MAIILELRQRLSHAGIPLVHPTSEHVVLANVFGILKNFSATAVTNPWLQSTTQDESVDATDWKFSFWEKQKRPIGPVGEGSTEVDLILESDKWLVFVEVKMDAEPSHGTRSDPERNQLIRNLDIGYHRAQGERKRFALIYITPDNSQPGIVARIRSEARSFPANAEVDPTEVTGCLSWSSWSALGDALANSYNGGKLDDVERKFALDLLAYLCGKRLWANTLGDDRQFYEDKLYKSLRRSDSPFVPYASGTMERYQAWRTKPWHQSELRAFLQSLRPEDKALLKLLADAGGALQQRQIMDQLPFLKGRTSASLRSLKSHVNAGCKQADCAPILSEGSGSGDYRIHEISRNLGSELRALVLDVAKQFEIDWRLLQRETLDLSPFLRQTVKTQN